METIHVSHTQRHTTLIKAKLPYPMYNEKKMMNNAQQIKDMISYSRLQYWSINVHIWTKKKTIVKNNKGEEHKKEAHKHIILNTQVYRKPFVVMSKIKHTFHIYLLRATCEIKF